MTASRIRAAMLVFSALIFCVHAFAQMNTAGANTPSFKEKIFVHTDKNFYVTGEIIWFKIYATDAESNQPDSVSKIAYAEILSSSNKQVLQAKIQLKNGMGTGSFQLPTSINSGNYTFRSYTSWMKNFDASEYFHQDLHIVNTFKPAQFSADDDTLHYDVQFFPEGGNLISDRENMLGFKVTEANGNGIPGQGNILDDQNNIITSFSTLKFGMGRFNFTPVLGKRYHAVTTVEGREITTILPESRPGFLIHVDNSNAATISIRVLGNTATDISRVFLLTQNSQSGNELLPVNLLRGEAVVSIATAPLPEGVTSFVLLDDNKIPVCERLFFKRPASMISLGVSSDKPTYSKREKISIDIAGTNFATTNASLSVYLADTLQGSATHTIADYFMLERVLKGTVESPEYYLSSKDADAALAADNLMLTQGWRKFVVNSTPVEKTVQFLPELEGHIISGKVTDKRNGAPAAGVTTYLSVPGKNFKLALSISDQQGLIRFNVPDFTGSEEIIVQCNQLVDSNYRIEIFNPFSENFASVSNFALQVNENYKDQLLQRSLSSQVLNAYYQEQQHKFLAGEADSLPFFGSADRKYLLDDYTRFRTMEEVLREYVPEIAPRKHHNSFRLKVTGKDAVLFDENPLVLADGVPYFNMDTVIAFDPLKIKSLSIVDKKYYYGPSTFYGIVSYSTYNGDLDGFTLDPNSLVVDYNGMQLQREFYSPKYESDLQRKSRLPDFRNTLFWEPGIQLEKNEKKKLNFYSSDIPGKYLIVINGLTADGKPVAASLAFIVE